jgi:hypothetical protein
MKNGMDIHKSRLSHAMSACVENGQRLHQDAEWLGTDRSATAVALCILAQEEFAKAFLLHLVWGLFRGHSIDFRLILVNDKWYYVPGITQCEDFV